jgi:hypothetical protein
MQGPPRGEDARQHPREEPVNEAVSRRVLDELEASGYEPRLHPPADEHGVFEIKLPGAGFDIDDFKSMVRVAEAEGLGMRLDDRGSITLR